MVVTGEKNKIFIAIIIVVLIIGGVIYLSMVKKEFKWQFTGYLSPVGEVKEETIKFASQEDCESYGKNWLDMRKELGIKVRGFNCAFNCRLVKERVGKIEAVIPSCQKICEYNENGILIGCR